MEGISSEVSSLAGHLCLDNLVVIYDSNKTCLDGYVSDSFSEDVRKRYEAYGWDVYEIDGHSFIEIHDVLNSLQNSQKRPALVIAHTKIGFGITKKEGTPFAHSGALSLEEIIEAKNTLGIPFDPFSISEDVKAFFLSKKNRNENSFKEWKIGYEQWKEKYPHLNEELHSRSHISLDELKAKLDQVQIKGSISGRRASQIMLNTLADALPSLIGGSADLAKSDMTHLHKFGVLSKEDWTGRNIKYGVREFGMGTIAIGLAQTKWIPFIGTFLAFCDYMRSAIRLSAMMKLKVIYQLTHDSFYLGGDGPTHQPVEQLANLRAVPNLQVIRPADHYEVKNAWIAALTYEGPTALILSKQELPELEETQVSFEKGVGRGAYILRTEKGENIDCILIATGSEVALALQVADRLEQRGLAIRVISMPSWEIFERQDEQYKKSLLHSVSCLKVSIEAGCSQGWARYVLDGLTVSLNTYGLSGSAEELANRFGFTVEKIENQILNSLKETLYDFELAKKF
jgi:transketolase